MIITLETIVHTGQIAAIALGLFTACWGLTEFGSCLVKVMRGHYDRPNVRDLCPYHAVFAMFCITTILFCVARANTLGIVRMHSMAAGVFFLAGMTTTCLTVALGIWAKARTHHGAPLTPMDGHPALQRMFNMMIIVILAFVLLGLVRVGI